jgi:hypothetical protein
VIQKLSALFVQNEIFSASECGCEEGQRCTKPTLIQPLPLKKMLSSRAGLLNPWLLLATQMLPLEIFEKRKKSFTPFSCKSDTES